MAKIHYSALINDIKGKLSGSVLAVTKGIAYIRRHNSSPLKIRSSKQTQIRGQASTLSGEWYALSSVYKSLWNAYAASLPAGTSGFNSFLKLNSRLYYLFNKSKKLSYPPQTPSTPKHVRTISGVCFTAGKFEINWQLPYISNTFVLCDYRPILPIYKTSSLPWKFGFTSSSLSQRNSINTYLENARPCDFRVRSFDIYGRVSPWSHIFNADRFNPGFTWSDLGQQFSQTQIRSVIYLTNGICLTGTGTGGKILRSTDYGATWSDLGQQFSQTRIYSLSYLGNGICLAGTYPSGKILRSTDYGLTWSDLGQQFSQSEIRSLAYLTNGICLAGTYPSGKILRSTDYGATWSDLGQQFSQTQIHSLAYPGNGICLAGSGANGKILRSTDYGATWSDLGQQFSQTDIFSLAYLSNGICLAGTYPDGKILRSNC